MWYRSLLRPLLFRAEPESAHDRVAALMRSAAALPGVAAALAALFEYRSPRLACRQWDLDFPNPVGLAAGFDKTGELYPFLAAAGFGFVECGTFTAVAQSGNPRPRLFRFPRERALVNRLGFNNPGAERGALNLRGQRRRVPRGISIGKSRGTELAAAAADHRASLRHLAPYADYVALNVSSPNTPGLRSLQTAAALHDLLADARSALAAENPRAPLLLKLAPDLDDHEFEASLAAAGAAGAAGFILTNTTLARAAGAASSAVEGGLSGEPLRARSTALVRRAYRLTGGRLPLVGVGGIFSGADALEKIRAGAALVQIYTGYIFEGPALPRRIARYLDRICRRQGGSLADLVGTSTSGGP